MDFTIVLIKFARHLLAHELIQMVQQVEGDAQVISTPKAENIFFTRKPFGFKYEDC